MLVFSCAEIADLHCNLLHPRGATFRIGGDDYVLFPMVIIRVGLFFEFVAIGGVNAPFFNDFGIVSGGKLCFDLLKKFV